MNTKFPWTLYLDFDGVLNNDPFLRQQRNLVPKNEHKLFDPDNVVAADHLCREIPVAEIVVTSTWREGRSIEQLRNLLAAEGFGHSELVMGVTASTGNRADEIRAHITANHVQSYLVLDDMNLQPLARPEFFQTSPAVGLDMALSVEIIATLH